MRKHHELLKADLEFTNFRQPKFEFVGACPCYFVLDAQTTQSCILLLPKIQNYALDLQKKIDATPVPNVIDEIDGLPPTIPVAGFTIGLQDHLLVRALVGTRGRRVQLWLERFFISHLDPQKLVSLRGKIFIDLRDDLAALSQFVKDCCPANDELCTLSFELQ